MYRKRERGEVSGRGEIALWDDYVAWLAMHVWVDTGIGYSVRCILMGCYISHGHCNLPGDGKMVKMGNVETRKIPKGHFVRLVGWLIKPLDL